MNIIIGLGKSGQSCARFLQHLGEPFAFADTRQAPPDLESARETFHDVEIQLGSLSAEFLQRATRIIVSPGVSTQHAPIILAQERGIEVIGDIELFARYAKAPVVAITGTNGKSTVTAWVSEALTAAGLDARMGGNIGVPALDLLREDLEQSHVPDVYVLECSSYQLETTHSLRPKVACFLNISPDHLDRHGSFDDYCQAKRRVYHNADIAIYNRDDALTEPRAKVAVSQNIGASEPTSDNEYGLRQHNGEHYLAVGEDNLMPVNQICLAGKHNWFNALAVLAIADALGAARAPVLKVLASFKGLAHRCEWVARADDITWYNDSKATNVGATIASLEGLAANADGDFPDAKTILIAGGIGKGADFAELRLPVQQHARSVVLIGEAAPELASSLASKTDLHFADSLLAAIELARQCALPGDRVLLAPACASFDMFLNFEDRGEQFCRAVKDLVNGDRLHGL